MNTPNSARPHRGGGGTMDKQARGDSRESRTNQPLKSRLQKLEWPDIAGHSAVPVRAGVQYLPTVPTRQPVGTSAATNIRFSRREGEGDACLFTHNE